jgi:ATP-dependent Clp endopeptidase proteolytic subunit ClpP
MALGFTILSNQSHQTYKQSVLACKLVWEPSCFPAVQKASVTHFQTAVLSSGTQGKITDQEITLREGLFLKQRLNEILAKNTGQKLAKVEKDADRDFWMSAEEAKKYGLIDQIVDKA